MKNIKVNIGTKSYNIVIGYDAIKHLPFKLKDLGFTKEEIFIVTNNQIKKRYAGILKSILKKDGFYTKFYTTIDSEKAKSINNSVKLIESLAEYAKQKKVIICAFGGGVVGDLASFVASIYKRGIPLIQIPTTLLAQIDSSIGGKTAIDLRIAKNLVGTFYQPRLVICDSNFLMSLDKKQLRAGLAEAVKYAVIKDEKLFSFLEEKYHSILSRDIETLERLVYECAKIKAKIVEVDEKEEKGIRTILNFGHTIGHAIEAAGDYGRYNHGEAITLGMLSAARISQNIGILSSAIYQRIANLIANIGLPQEVTGIKEKDVLKAYKLDKKFIGKTNRFVLIKGIGSPVVYKDIPEKIIFNSIKELFIYPDREQSL